jgi:hypothetical protein
MSGNSVTIGGKTYNSITDFFREGFGIFYNYLYMFPIVYINNETTRNDQTVNSNKHAVLSPTYSLGQENRSMDAMIYGGRKSIGQQKRVYQWMKNQGNENTYLRDQGILPELSSIVMPDKTMLSPNDYIIYDGTPQPFPQVFLNFIWFFYPQILTKTEYIDSYFSLFYFVSYFFSGDFKTKLSRIEIVLATKDHNYFKIENPVTNKFEIIDTSKSMGYYVMSNGPINVTSCDQNGTVTYDNIIYTISLLDIINETYLTLVTYLNYLLTNGDTIQEIFPK